MDTVDNISRSLDSVLKSIYSNKVASAVIGLFLVLYAGLAAPKLPRSISKLFGNKVIKIVILFFVAYMSSRNTSISIIAAVALAVSIQTLSRHESTKKVIQAVEEEVMEMETPEELYSESETEETNLNEESDDEVSVEDEISEVEVESESVQQENEEVIITGTQGEEHEETPEAHDGNLAPHSEFNQEHHEMAPEHHEMVPEHHDMAPEHHEMVPEHHDMAPEHHEMVPEHHDMPHEEQHEEELQKARQHREERASCDQYSVSGFGGSEFASF